MKNISNKESIKHLFRIMKIMLLFLFVLIGSVFATDTYSQIKKVTIANSNISVKRIIHEIEKQTDYLFIYNEKEIDLKRCIDFSVKDTPVSEVLNKIFKSTDISYAMEGKNIMLISKSNATTQQKNVITGIVIDSEGFPIIGANIQVEGNSIGTITDIDGKFSINAAIGSVLNVTYIGYITTEVKVGNKKNLTIVMREDTKILDEVIVVGYGAVTRKNLTTSVAKVKTDEIPKAANSNMSQMLMGRAAGLQATVASAQPGGAVNISIRGAGTPIYVIDGVVMPGDALESDAGADTSALPASINRSGLVGLNPEDIESIEVLKDASASIYGIGAANGVILITTKKGKEGRVRITYDGSMSLVKNYPYLDMLDAQDYMRYVNSFAREQYMYQNGMGVYGDKTYDGNFADVFDSDRIASAQTTNWRDMILRNGSISNHNITISGGSNKLLYYLSGNYFKQIGTVQASEMERYTLHSNIKAQLTSFLRLSSFININHNVNENGTVGGSTWNSGASNSGSLAAAMSYPTYLPLRDEEGRYTSYQTIPNGVAMSDIENVSRSTGYNLNFTLDIDIIKDMLAAKLLYGYNNESASRSVYVPSDVYYGQMYMSRGGIGRAERNNTTMEASLNFHKSFNKLLDVDAVVGMGQYVNNSTGLQINYTDNNDVIANDNISAAAGKYAPSSYRTSDEKRSQFARASVDLLDRYVISGTIRRDGTDKFFKGKKYAWFPSVSVAWKIFNEKFMQLPWVNMLKLRASYGVTGSDNLGSTLYGAYTPTYALVMFNENSSKYVPYYLKSKDYPNVTWEKTVMKNIGLDFSFLKDRINGSLDYFSNDITNMLGWDNSAGLSMFGTYPLNGGHIRRYGWDININTVNINSPNFKWTSSLTLSHYNSIWKERMPNYDYKVYQKRENEPVNALYFYRTAGIVNADRSNMPSFQPECYRLPGCPIIEDLDGDGAITVKDIDMVNVIPSLYWGFGNTFNYKNWDLSIFIYSQLGLKKQNYAYSWASANSMANQTSNQSLYIKDVWHSELNPNGTLPGIASSLASVSLPGGAWTDVDYRDASFVRVRNITLGYNFSAANLGTLSKYISGFRLYVDVQNPLTFTKFEGFDPEVNIGGYYNAGKAEYPQIRTYSVGMKLSF